MTIEDIKDICRIYDNFRREQDAVTLVYNSEDTFWEHILATYNLSKPSLSSDLDEAADEYAPDFSDSIASKAAVDAVREAFKAGAKWMAGQGHGQAEVTKWTEEDENMFDNILQTERDCISYCNVDSIGTKARFCYEEEIEWLKSIKQRISFHD